MTSQGQLSLHSGLQKPPYLWARNATQGSGQVWPNTSEHENCPLIHYQISLTKCMWVRRTTTSMDPLSEGPTRTPSLNLSVGTWTLPEAQCRPGSLETRQRVRFSSCVGLSGDFWPWLLPSDESRWPFLLLVYEEFPLKSSSHSYRKKKKIILCRAEL